MGAEKTWCGGVDCATGAGDVCKCMQQASYLEEGPLVWMLLLYLHVNQKSNDDMMI